MSLEHAVGYLAPSGIFHLTWLLIALPAASAAVLLLGGRRTNSWGHLLGCAAPIASFVIALIELVAMLGRDSSHRQIDQHLFTWVPVAGFHAEANLLLDPLSLTFVLLITGVGSLIHIYSIGYMEHDPDRRRFFGQLNLFVAVMLLLVLADNFLLMYVGWEGVGLASYLLIGFWHYKPSAAVAAKKAFVVNRVGDFGLSLAIMLMFATFGTFSFAGVFTGAHGPGVHGGTLTAIGLLLLLGACAKSAQAPLQSWLLDAMEGPTPVSALIHAATMVTAGVYLVARSAPLYNVAPDARTAVEVVGAVTLVMGAIIGCAYDDIKKVLAASTMSQIGYMMLAVGLGPGVYAIGILHLLTHGFFKANMFLGAGSVMHGTNDDVDMRHYGALRKVMPVTFLTFAMGYLAIIGFPGFSGFWSKDRIIEAAFGQNLVVGIAATVGAGITAFYMTRVMLMTFFGEKRWAEDAHPHESPKVMTVPLLVLAALSVLGGLLLLGSWIIDWLSPVVGRHVLEELSIPPLALSGIITATVLVGIAIAWLTVGRNPVPREAPANVSVLTRAARADLYGDAINEELLMRPGDRFVNGLVTFDDHGIDGAVNGTGATFGGLSGRMRRLQTGFVRSYALSLLSGAIVVVVALLAVNLA
jgi:NADH-quinone oxidoreductase subunit L